MIAAMFLILPAVSFLTLALLGWLVDLYSLLIFVFMGVSPVIVGVYIALAVWLAKRKYNVIFKVAVFLITLAILLSFIYFAIGSFWVLTNLRM